MNTLIALILTTITMKAALVVLKNKPKKVKVKITSNES